MKVSNCCGVYGDYRIPYGDTYETAEICHCCGEHCEYVDESEVQYVFYMIWCRTFEGDRRWHFGRFLPNTDQETAFDVAKNSLSGGVGGDAAEILEIEGGYDDGLWHDYTYYQ